MTLVGCQQNKKDFYKTAELQNGFPEILKPLEKDLPFNILSHALLETKNDSINIYFGSLSQGEQKGNWIALASNDQIKQFRSVSLNKNVKDIRENDIDMNFNNSTNRISLRVKELDSLNNNITYSWINKSRLADSLEVITIDMPLARGKAFPAIVLKDLDGKKYDFDNSEDDIIVLNWWAVWCAPCRKEIPGLNKLVDKYGNKNVRFIAITDDSKESVNAFLENNQFNYDITFISEATREIFGNSYPKNIILDKSEKITFYKDGGNEFVWQEIDQHLKALQLKEN